MAFPVFSADWSFLIHFFTSFAARRCEEGSEERKTSPPETPGKRFCCLLISGRKERPVRTRKRTVVLIHNPRAGQQKLEARTRSSLRLVVLQ
jgi:hypothetical protein